MLRSVDADGGIIEYQYDAAGNLLARISPSQSLVYGYDARNRLIEVTRSGIRPLRPKTWKWGFRTYNPEIERRYLKHRDRTVASLRALINHRELPTEQRAREAGRAGLPPPIEGDEAP